MPRMATSGRPVSFWMRFEDIEALDAEAALRGITRSALVMELVRRVTQPSPAAPAE